MSLYFYHEHENDNTWIRLKLRNMTIIIFLNIMGPYRLTLTCFTADYLTETNRPSSSYVILQCTL